jgi:hypothetical protein
LDTLGTVARRYWFGQVKKTNGMWHLVADAGAPDQTLTGKPGINLELFGTLSGSQSRQAVLQTRVFVWFIIEE